MPEIQLKPGRYSVAKLPPDLTVNGVKIDRAATYIVVTEDGVEVETLTDADASEET